MACFGGRFETLVDIVLPSELDCSVKVDLSGGLELALVANEVDSYIFSRVLLDLFQPASQVFESLIPRDVIGQEDAMSTTVKNPRHRFERFLTSGIPNLELDDFVVYLETIRAEFDADCHLMLLLELVVHDALH